MTPDCPDPAALDQYLQDALPEEAATALVAHVETCHHCRQVLDPLSAPAAAPAAPGATLDPDYLERLRRLPPRPDRPTTLVGAATKDGPHGDTPAAPPAPGRLGPFEILGELGRGGMGVVYKARQPGLNRLVALKVIRAYATGLEERVRFRLEAEAVARLQHPNIVQVYEVGEHDGQPYLVFELVEGGTLERLTGKPHPPAVAAELVEALARAVAYAHSRGVVHRDLKPANVLLQMGNGEWGMGNEKKGPSSFP